MFDPKQSKAGPVGDKAMRKDSFKQLPADQSGPLWVKHSEAFFELFPQKSCAHDLSG